ncbi:MAG: hypothetical protein L3J59_08435 [Methylococcaceae bacterium]|nr:hypothetical protein [Methylococcaceae bacterium]
MEIHSSSLAYIPKKIEAKKNNANKPFTPNEVGLKEPALAKSQSKPHSTSISNISNIDAISNGINKRQPALLNTQSNRALNAYIQENIQPLKDQHSELVSRVDFYI